MTWYRCILLGPSLPRLRSGHVFARTLPPTIWNKKCYFKPWNHCKPALGSNVEKHSVVYFHIQTNESLAVFTYLVPCDAFAGNICNACSRYVHLRTIQCAGLFLATYLRVPGPLVVLSGLCCAHDQPEPELLAGIPVKSWKKRLLWRCPMWNLNIIFWFVGTA